MGAILQKCVFACINCAITSAVALDLIQYRPALIRTPEVLPESPLTTITIPFIIIFKKLSKLFSNLFSNELSDYLYIRRLALVAARIWRAAKTRNEIESSGIGGSKASLPGAGPAERSA